MTLRRRPLLSILLALFVALTGLGTGVAAPHAAGAGQGLTEVVICGDDGARTIVVDAEGNPVEEEHERSCCDGLCIACAGSSDPVAVLGVPASALSTCPEVLAESAEHESIPAFRRAGQQARAPPGDRP